MTKNKMGALASVAVLALGLGACGKSSTSGSSSSSKTTITGAGSTFAAPVYEQWGSQISDITLNYDPVGSGAGITSLEGKTVYFGASDPPLKAEELEAVAKNGSPAVQIPMFLGAITISYNLPGVATGLKLDGTTVANIYFGKIKTWNSPEIAALNPGVKLPSTAITVIHRSDSSGTTAGFTGWLASVDPEWESKVGSGKVVPWPTGTGAKGNAGVAAAVEQTTGAVGYVEQAYALKHKFTYASVKNKSGAYIAPTLSSTSAAAEGIVIPVNLGFKIKNPTSPAAYPITSQTFIVVNKDLCKAGVSESGAKGVVKFLNYGLTEGQSILSQADYAALPTSILERSKAALAGLQCNGNTIG